ncbi:MAG: TlpA disulfide reductase family protein [Ginsengibacter sp.]
MKALLFIIIISSLVLLSQTIKSQTFNLAGHLQGRDTGWIVLRYYDSHEKWVQDTTNLKKGNFKFQGQINEPTYASLKGYDKEINFDEVNYVGIFLEPTFQKISLKENDYQNADTKGSISQKEYDILRNSLNSIELKWKPENDEFLEAKKNAIAHQGDSLVQKKYNILYKKLQPKYNTITHAGISFIGQHPDSYVSAYFLGIYLNQLSIDSLELLYSRFTSRIKNSRFGKWDFEEIEKIKQTSIGSTAPEFDAKDINDKKISLYNLRGRLVLLDFWASWCIPCIENFPYLKNLYRQYHTKGFEIVAISIDRSNEDWMKAVDQQKVGDWINVLVNATIRNNYRNTTLPIPSEILIDESGKIIWTSNNENNIEKLGLFLKKYLN